MSKKLYICKGKSCKKERSFKKIKKWVQHLEISNKIKKSGCLGMCKTAYGIKYKDRIYSCQSESELEKIVFGNE